MDKPSEEESAMQSLQSDEEKLQKIVDSIVKKAEFLLQLIPAKYWSKGHQADEQRPMLFI